ncbi:3,4-dihydroxy-2-butanone 4-phosphate synthase [Drechslerella stenobrocha 248]|uniref:3,4-dihydroxy-2-butanone 4-phosphate synthase n=1 Tax=Drechslerella stenobrocha 248 TaxID=1043628 RepID=W7I7L4_9PEZI|nr:3,4-dihydroxy-2-butanone 4-phosphate synthase [Drechslerella stenobrocha 248]
MAVTAANTNGAEHLFDSIEDSVAAFKRGEFLVVLDSTDRENEGDLIIAAQDVTTAQMAFMVRHTSGYVCVPMTPDRTKRLQLPQMVPQNEDALQTAYTISADYAHGTTTGISAHDRALTVRQLADPTARPDDFRRPGHVLPLRARRGGVRVRRGHTEAAVELCRLAGKEEVAAICEIVRDEDGLMARRDDCVAFAKRWGVKVCTIEDLTAYVEAREGVWRE